MFVQKRLGKTRKHQKETGGDWDRTEQDETRLDKTKQDQIGRNTNVPESDRNVEKMEVPWKKRGSSRKHQKRLGDWTRLEQD